MSFGIKEEKLVSVEDRDLLKWVKDNKAKLEEFKAFKSDSTSYANILNSRLENLEEEEEKEKSYFDRVEAAVELNKSKIEQNKTAFGTLGDIISKNAIGAKNARTQLSKAIKFAEDNQQKEITDRMEAMRTEFEKKQVESNAMLEETRNMLGTMRGLEFQLNQKVQDVLNARKNVFQRG